MNGKTQKLNKVGPPPVDPVKSLLHRVQTAYLPKHYVHFLSNLPTLAQSDVGRKVQDDWHKAQASLHGDKEAGLKNEILYRRENGKEKELLKRVSLSDNPVVFLLLLQHELLRRKLAECEPDNRPPPMSSSIGFSLKAMMEQDPIERRDLARQSHEERLKEENERRRVKEQQKEAETRELLSKHARRSYRGVLQSKLPNPTACLWFDLMTITDYVEATGQGEDKIEAFLRSNGCKPIECSARNKRQRYSIETNFKVLNHWLCDWARYKRRLGWGDKRPRISGEELGRRTHDLRLSWLAVTIVHCRTSACDRLDELLLRLEPSFSFLCSTEPQDALTPKVQKLMKLSPPMVPKPDPSGLFLPTGAS